MRYYYLDESYIKAGSAWHCCIGGALADPGQVVDLEIELFRVFREFPSISAHERQREFQKPSGAVISCVQFVATATVVRRSNRTAAG